MPIHVTEHRLKKYLDDNGQTVLPHVPDLQNQPIFGPRLLAMIGWLKSRAHCSYSTIAIWMDDVLQVPVSRGYLVKLCNRIFSVWHRRDGMTDAGFYRSMVTHRNRFLEVVLKPPNSSEASNLTARFQTIELVDGSHYDMSQDYFRFMFEPGVEPTNNHSEQQVRHCVIDRRITQGTRSEAGQRYHERMWTAIATCGKQGRSFFRFLHESISASLSGGQPPRLLSE